MALLVGKHAPQFKSKAVINGQIVDEFSLAKYKGKYILFFFYPLDFTFVCPTELIAFQESLAEFHHRDCEVVGCSIDSVFTHLAWLNTPRSKGGIEGVKYPLVADINKTIAKSYDVLSEEEGIAYRGLFLIDKQGIVRHQIVNDLPLGRSVAEAMRTLDALIFINEHGEVCPADWKEGKKSMVPTQAGLERYFANV